jgi:hypothetical protein
VCRPTTKKEYGGLNSTRLGKREGDERLEIGTKLKSLIPRIIYYYYKCLYKDMIIS